MIPLNPLSLRHGLQNGHYGHFRVSIDDDDVAGGGGTEGRALGGPGSPGGILGAMAAPGAPFLAPIPAAVGDADAIRSRDMP